jgi:hypothetical protein
MPIFSNEDKINFNLAEEAETTVILTSYNQLQLLYDALISILDQNEYFKLILIDDASNPSEFVYENILEFIIENKNSYLVTYSIIRNNHNLGHFKTLSVALSMVNTNFVVYVNGDDKLPSNSLTNLLEFQKSGNFDLVGGKLITQYLDGSYHMHDLDDSFDITKTNLLINRIIMGKAPFTLPGSLIRTSKLVNNDYFDQSYKYFEDAILFFKLVALGKVSIGISNTPSYIWRNYSGVSSEDKNNIPSVEKKIDLLRDYIGFHDELINYHGDKIDQDTLYLISKNKNLNKVKLKLYLARSEGLLKLLIITFSNFSILAQLFSPTNVYRFFVRNRSS